MATSASLITLATLVHEDDIPGTLDQVRDRLEWTWGLGRNHFDEHLQGFPHPHRVFTDDSRLVFPHTSIIQKISLRNAKAKFGARRPHIQKVYKGCTSFEYLVVPIVPGSAPTFTLISDVPPHLALCTTSAKIMRAWGYLTGRDYDAVQLSLIERINTAWPTDTFDVSTIDTIENMHHYWTSVDHVPPSFLFEHSDQAKLAESVRSLSDSGFSSNMAWEVGSSASCYHEPKRRLLPSERQADFPSANIRMFPSADGMEDDGDNVMSEDSEDPEENADLAWMDVISQWAEGATDADADALNDAQIKEDSKEAPRFAASLDLAKPDYEPVAAKKGLRTNL
ncbi:hypothetical protein DFH06DRAFT_1482814 [Mycena polygramma]|nr:hypothetical protein DFH06DRAFT_1312012 [Mycena polygramma]KAJ7620019.1 hypothetical protein DFH06DRAFT_1482814 [Mycena polygramma]